MQKFSAYEAKQNFGRIIDQALQAPVSVTKHGRPSVVITSQADYQELLDLKREILKAEVTKGFEGFDSSQFISKTPEDMAEQALRDHREKP